VSTDDSAPEVAREEFVDLMLARENRLFHVRHVSALALQLFDPLTPLHGLGARERLLLESAAHLHDIGHSADFAGAGHHKESARLIREHPWKGFSRPEVEIIAQVARYHRKAMPELAHDEFSALPESDRRIVQYLAAFLRLADSLDRTHAQHVTSIRVEALPNQLILRLESVHPIVREIRAAYKKADLAMAMFQRDVVMMIGDTIVRPTVAGPEDDEPASGGSV
jgi:exopolyphosphatase/guanosine-5'-triphosphate,3'-diphosphate pyrophosphatase